MNRIKKIELLKELEDYPLFMFNDFVRITGASTAYARTMLYRLKREGLIFFIERGKYTVHKDPLIFASYIFLPSYISFWTALRFYNLTDQLPREIAVATPVYKKSLKFAETPITFTKIREFWGYKKERYGRFEIFIAEKEKCVIDSLLVRKVPLDEIFGALQTKELNIEKLIEFAIRTKNKSLIKRLGYLLELCEIDASDLHEKIYTDRNYIALDWNFPKKGERNPRWKLIINKVLG